MKNLEIIKDLSFQLFIELKDETHKFPKRSVIVSFPTSPSLRHTQIKKF